jgi:hypothetical protein
LLSQSPRIAVTSPFYSFRIGFVAYHCAAYSFRLPFAAKSSCNRILIAAQLQLLRNCCTDAAQSMVYRCAIAVLSLCKRCINAWYLRNQFKVAALLHRDRFEIAFYSLQNCLATQFNHFVIALLSLTIRDAIIV